MPGKEERSARNAALDRHDDTHHPRVWLAILVN